MQALSKDDSILLIIWLMLLIEQKLGAALTEARPGPAAKLSDLEVLTILVFDGLVEQHQSLAGNIRLHSQRIWRLFPSARLPELRPPGSAPDTSGCPAAKKSADW